MPLKSALAGLASELKPSLPTLALGNVTNAESIQCGVWPLNAALTLFGLISNAQEEDEIEFRV